MSHLIVGILLALSSLRAFAIYEPLAQSHLDEQIVEHKHYTLSYSEPHEVSRWVSYILETSKLKSCTERTNNFRPDPMVKTESATQADYQGSGFDRGHLLPAGDMRWDAEAMKETFFFSNMTPQPASFNRGKWKSVEELVRAWALKYKKIWVVVGPVLKDNLPVIGPHQVAVPDLYYKVILRQEGTKYYGIGVLMNTKLPYPEIASYTVSISEVENLTNIKFFPFLKDEDVKRKKDMSKWDLAAKFSYLPCGIE